MVIVGQGFLFLIIDRDVRDWWRGSRRIKLIPYTSTTLRAATASWVSPHSFTSVVHKRTFDVIYNKVHHISQLLAESPRVEPEHKAVRTVVRGEKEVVHFAWQRSDQGRVDRVRQPYRVYLICIDRSPSYPPIEFVPLIFRLRPLVPRWVSLKKEIIRCLPYHQRDCIQ